MYRIGNRKRPIVHQAGHHQRHQDIQNGADRQRCDERRRNRALWASRTAQSEDTIVASPGLNSAETVQSAAVLRDPKDSALPVVTA